MNLKPVDMKTVAPEVFRVFGENYALLTAGDKSACNTMTIGWCGMGRVWNLPACTVYVRPERYTYEFMEKHDYFTVCVLPKDKKQVMALCGTKSGRDTDKIKMCDLTLRYGAGDAPFFDEAELAVVCRKLYVQDMKPEHVVNHEAIDNFYEDAGWHRMYVGQVVEVYQKK